MNSTSQEVPLDITHNPFVNTLTVLLESAFPFYGFFHELVLDALGFDITMFVSVPLLAFAALQGGRYIWDKMFGIFHLYFMSSVHIDDWDDIFSSFCSWIVQQPGTKNCRTLSLEERSASLWDDDDDSDDESEWSLFNYDSWTSRLPLEYRPWYGRYIFWHKKRLFFFSFTKYERQWGPEKDRIEISCIGRSAMPIKKMLEDVKQWSLSKEKHLTTVRRPVPSKSGETKWKRILSRPSRSIDTVCLDMPQKVKIVKDVNEYLQPATQRWYAARGIPHRRGYLFHGPPGTGKTSLSFALAGLFGLNIYCISLNEPTLTENDLANLFNDLPSRCIVLLEDIDSAGLRRSGEEAESDDEESENEETEDNGAAPTKGDNASTKKVPKKAHISLSGLLNAIDGVSSHEGRVLIMTTNHPEKLDDALIRPGRVDLQVGFTLATREQIRDIFIRMYTIAEDEMMRSEKLARAAKDTASGQLDGTTEKANGPAKPPADDFYALVAWDPAPDPVSPEELKDMAEKFAERLPDKKFSPAEVQGYLLIRKKEPRRALEDSEGWRDGLLESKEKNSKVVAMQ